MRLLTLGDPKSDRLPIKILQHCLSKQTFLGKEVERGTEEAARITFCRFSLFIKICLVPQILTPSALYYGK